MELIIYFHKRAKRIYDVKYVTLNKPVDGVLWITLLNGNQHIIERKDIKGYTIVYNNELDKIDKRLSI